MRRGLLLAAAMAAAAAGCRSGPSLQLGAIADTHGATAETLANLDRFSAVFSQAHVDAVLALGDLGESEDDIATVLTRLGAAHAPVYALPGELEPESAFHAAVKRARAAGVQIVDLVDTRQVRVSGATIVAVPGYAFSQHGYKYGAADLERARKLAEPRWGTLVVAAHGPPKGNGRNATDWAMGDVNAGDPALTDFLNAVYPNATLFAHVDEAGGRGDRMGINVGSAAEGVAAVVELRGGTPQTRVLQ